SSAGRAPALQVSSLQHTSAASGVAYAQTFGATTLLNWTEAGPSVVLTSSGLHRRVRFVEMSTWHSNLQPFRRTFEKDQRWARKPSEVDRPNRFSKLHSESYWIFFETRAINSSNLDSKSFRTGDSFDFL